MKLTRLVEASAAVAATRSRKQKVAHLAACLREVAHDDVEAAVAFLSGSLPMGKIGVGRALLRKLNAEPTLEPQLTVAAVRTRLEEVGATAGKGSQATRQTLLGQLWTAATADEQRFLYRLLTGELRQGALEGVLLDGVAAAASLEPALVRRAAMLAGSLTDAASAALREGAAGLARFRLTPLRPVQPMLAGTALDCADMLTRLGEASLEWKLDGARIQVHKAGEEVRVFSRQLNDVTHAVPEVVKAARALSARAMILDGEVLALRGDGAPHPFQTTMRRFGRRRRDAELEHELPLTPFWFDCLLVDDQPLIDASGAERVQALESLGPGSVPRLVTADPEAAERFYDQALERGHEGLVAKSLDAPYAAGKRGASWLKLKPAHTLDLVVLAAEWGSGRREGWLSNLHLGARADATGSELVMLGKTFKGLTDELLRWQTAQLLAREVRREGHVVHVRPELVIEVAVGDVQRSPHYPAGLALRFARVRRYREDKTPPQATHVDEVRALLR